MRVTASDRAQRFTFTPGQLEPVTDEQELNSIHQRTGVEPYSSEKQEWVSREAVRLFNETDEDFDTEQLAKRYDRLKAEGKL